MRKKISIILICILLTGCASKNTGSFVSNDYIYQPPTNYFYNLLSNKDKELYDGLYNAFINQDTKVKSYTDDSETIRKVESNVMQDHPDIFYVKSISIDSKKNVIIDYYYNSETISKLKKELVSKRKEIIKEVKNKSTYQQIEYLYNYVIKNVAYNENASYNQEITSAMLNKESVCSGYCKMFQYLCLGLDIPCSYMQGKPIGKDTGQFDGHSWNMIYYQFSYYYIDTTWGDSLEDKGIVDDSYLMFNSSEMLKLYEPTDTYQKTINSKNCYFDSKDSVINNYSLSNVEEVVRKNMKDDYVILKFTDSNFYSSKSKLINSKQIFTVLTDVGINVDNTNYIANDQLNTLIIEW